MDVKFLQELAHLAKMAVAAGKGNMEVVQWLVAKGCPISNHIIVKFAAAQHGSLINIKRLWKLDVQSIVNPFWCMLKNMDHYAT